MMHTRPPADLSDCAEGPQAVGIWEDSTVPGESEVRPKKGLTFRTATIGLVVILFVAFSLMNLQTAPVRPFGEKPVILVILTSFLLGALIGWLVRRPHSTRKDGA
jgi:uncharacterized integral membrane protein